MSAFKIHCTGWYGPDTEEGDGPMPDAGGHTVYDYVTDPDVLDRTYPTIEAAHAALTAAYIGSDRDGVEPGWHIQEQEAETHVWYFRKLSSKVWHAVTLPVVNEDREKRQGAPLSLSGASRCSIAAADAWFWSWPNHYAGGQPLRVCKRCQARQEGK